MRRRGGQDLVDEIELLDVDPVSAVELDHVETGSSGRTGLAATAVIAIAAVVAVVGVGNEASPPEPPGVTIDERQADQDSPISEEQSDDFFGAAIGDGPGLVWEPVRADLDARYWRWNGDSFVSDNGVVELRLELAESGPAVTERASPLIGYPEHTLRRFEGGLLLVPDGSNPDHVVIVADEREAVRIDLPPLSEPQRSELTNAQVWLFGERVGDRVVVTRTGYADVDMAALEARIGRDLTDVVRVGVSTNQIDFYTRGPGPIPEPIPLADTDLSETEIAELRHADQPIGDVLTADLVTGIAQPIELTDFEYVNDLLIGLDGKLLLGWTDAGGVNWMSTTFDGETWSTERRGMERWLVNSGSQLFDFNTQGASISRSSDGQVWNLTPVPLRETQRTVADDIVVLGASWVSDEIGGVGVETGVDGLTLYMFDDGQRFEIRGRSPFAEPLTGWTDDPASGAAWDRATNTLTFTNPRTGEELFSVPGHAIERAFALQSPMEQMAMARWPADVENPEWLVTSPVEVFGEGSLKAGFVAGDGYLLAIITTIDSIELYLTDTQLS